MKTFNGRLITKKSERDDFRRLIAHVRADISYGAGGTFVKDTGDPIGEEADIKEIERVQNAIYNLEWILENVMK